MPMRTTLAVSLLCSTLLGCGGGAGIQPPQPASPTGVVDSGSAATQLASSSRPALGLEVLPATANTSTIRTASSLLQRPKSGSVVLQALNAGDTVQWLGTLDNVDGSWVSIGVGDVQGWVRASEITP